MTSDSKILVVDDDRNIVALLQEALTAESLTVIPAYNGEEAFQLFENQNPNLLIIDALLPKMNGFELATKIRASSAGSNLPIIMISGIYRALRMNEQLRELDINEFLEKPFDLEILLAKIKQLLQVSVEAPNELDFFNPRGDLADLGFPRLLYLLYRNKENGILLLVKDKLKKKITIKNGEPAFVESNLVQECLGRLLVRKGRLTDEQVESSLTLMKSQKTRQGETLINMGLLSPNELDEALRDQAREKLFDIFSWEQCEYRFVAQPVPTTNITQIDLTLPQLLVRGVRNAYAIDRLKREMGGSLDKEIHLRQNTFLKFEEFRLATWDERILHEINGEHTLRHVVDSKLAREIDIFQLLHVFLKTDMIEFTETQEEKQDKVTQAKLTRYLEELKEQDYYTMLGVSPFLDEKQLFMAFGKKMSQYHPNTSSMNPRKVERLNTLLRDISTQLQNAHATISNAKERIAYDRQQFLTKGVVPAKPNDVFQADDEFLKIKRDLARGDFEAVQTAANAMASLFPKEARFMIVNGWAKFKLLTQRKSTPTESQYQECLNTLAAALRADPKQVDGYFYIGSIYKQLEDRDKARSFFQKTLEVSPGHVEAERELRLLQMRQDKKNKSFIKWK